MLIRAVSILLFLVGCHQPEGPAATHDTDTGTSPAENGTDDDTDDDTGDDTDSDTDTGGGIWCDDSSSLCWQVTPADSLMNGNPASSYCDDLELGVHSDWRLPSISELRSLIRGCPHTETGGGCNVADDCLGFQECNNDNCDGCVESGGPGSGGCYWDPALGDGCDVEFWSSSEALSDVLTTPETTPYWHARFSDGKVAGQCISFALAVRCVRTDAGSHALEPMIYCDGGKLDLETGLCWMEPPSGTPVNWYLAAGVVHQSNPDGGDYCGGLVHGGHSDWRLPNIDELITLLRGCRHGTATGTLAPSLCTMAPQGCAPAAESCEWSIDCSCCSHLSGPGVGGCYRDPELDGPCGGYWSSSSLDVPGYTFPWFSDFDRGCVFLDNAYDEHHVRCVR